MRKGSIFGSENLSNKNDFLNEIENKLIKFYLDKQSIEENISKNKKISSWSLENHMNEDLYFSLQVDSIDESIILEKIREGANVNYEYGSNGSCLVASIKNQGDVITKMLLQNGAISREIISTSFSDLGLVVAYCSDEMLSILLMMNIDLDKESKNDLAYLVIKQGYTSSFELLLKMGIDINGFQKCTVFSALAGENIVIPMTPLMSAAYFGNLKIAKMLVDNGASISIENEDGKKALDFVDDVSFVFKNRHDDNSMYENQEKEKLKLLELLGKSKFNNLIEKAKSDLDKVMKK